MSSRHDIAPAFVAGLVVIIAVLLVYLTTQ